MIRIIHIPALIAIVSCAVQSKPEGGPKDELPPKIITQEPSPGALNYDNGIAWVSFDEYIQGNSVTGNITSSPPLENLEYKIRGKKLTLDWDPKQLLQETTYRISLGNKIGDLNENNRVKNLEFIWSTGSYIDSMQINGQINKIGEGTFEDLLLWLLPKDSDSLNIPLFSTSPNTDGYYS